MVIYTFLLPPNEARISRFLFYLHFAVCRICDRITSSGLLPDGMEERAQKKKKRYCVITVSIIVFNNKFHLNREIHSAGRPELNVIYRFFFRFVLTCRVSFPPNHRAEGRHCLDRRKNEIINLLKSHFQLVFFFSPCEPSINARAMVNVISFMLENEQ